MNKYILYCVIFYFVSQIAHTQIYITDLQKDDTIYIQQQQLIAQYHDAIHGESPLHSLIIFSYKPKDNENIFHIAEKTSVPYWALTILNRTTIPQPHDNTVLLIPSQIGIFLFHQPESHIENLLHDRLMKTETPQYQKVILPTNKKTAYFFVNTELTSDEIDWLFPPQFISPLPQGYLSSPYGYRIHPISGIRSFHHGIDLATRFGSTVYSSGHGIVTGITRDGVYGLSIMIDHGNNYSTVYTHLAETSVVIGQVVLQKESIGRIGSTGISTGPHLHFEVRYRNNSKDPAQYFQQE